MASELGDSDPLFILPMLNWRIMNRLNPPNERRAKKYLMLGAPALTVALSIVLPAGVTLFWVAYQALMTAQEYFVAQHLFENV